MVDEGTNAHTSVVTSHGKLSEDECSSNENTDLVGETGPPDRDKDPDFVKDWDVPILSNPEWSTDECGSDQ